MSWDSRMADIDPRLLPCLYLPRLRSAMVVLEVTPDGFMVFDSKSYVWNDPYERIRRILVLPVED